MCQRESCARVRYGCSTCASPARTCCLHLSPAGHSNPSLGPVPVADLPTLYGWPVRADTPRRRPPLPPSPPPAPPPGVRPATDMSIPAVNYTMRWVGILRVPQHVCLYVSPPPPHHLARPATATAPVPTPVATCCLAGRHPSVSCQLSVVTPRCCTPAAESHAACCVAALRPLRRTGSCTCVPA